MRKGEREREREKRVQVDEKELYRCGASVLFQTSSRADDLKSFFSFD